MATVWDTPRKEVDESIIRDVEASKRGDRKAYARLVQRHQRLVASITLAITRDLDMSEDAAQEAFIEGWRDLAKLENLASFAPWICQIARHRAHDLLRKRKSTEPVEPETLEGAPDPDPGALDYLLEEERDELIARALETLPEDAREAIVLFYREGQSIADIAKAIDVSEEVVKKRLSRARERIRGKVEAAFGAALVASIPGGDFSMGVLGKLSSQGWLAKPATAAVRVATTVAKVGALTAAVVIAAPAVRNLVDPPQPPRIVATTRPAEIRGSILGLKNATGTATFDFEKEQRVAKIERGSFRLTDVPLGRCRVEFAIDGVKNPEPRDVTIRGGEHLQIVLKIDTVTVMTTATRD